VFFQADEALVADDDVVDQLDVEDATRRHELLRRLDILWLGRRVAARIVVAEDQAGACADDGGTEDMLPMGWMTVTLDAHSILKLTSPPSAVFISYAPTTLIANRP
jgi:hypothetical protein